jgi:hypothetical protein
VKAKASGVLGQAKDRAGGALGQAREKAGDLKATLADKLEAGADRLQQGSSGSRGSGGNVMAGAGADGGTTEVAAGDDPVGRVSRSVAGGMRSTAGWLRGADLDSIKSGIEEQVRTNPGRSLLIAAVAGYLLAKTFRR